MIDMMLHNVCYHKPQQVLEKHDDAKTFPRDSVTRSLRCLAQKLTSAFATERHEFQASKQLVSNMVEVEGVVRWESINVLNNRRK